MALCPVGYYLWQSQMTVAPRPAAATPQEGRPAPWASLPVPELRVGNAAAPATSARPAAPSPQPAATTSADAAHASAATTVPRQVEPPKDAFGPSLSYHLDPDSAKWAGDRPQTFFAQPASPEVPFAAARTAPVAAPPVDAQPAAPDPAADAPKFRLSSLIAGPRATTAIVNGRVVTVGDTVDGAKVVAISTQAVELEVAGKRVTLKLSARDPG